MFNGGDQIKVKTSLTFDEVCDRVGEILEDLGRVHISNSGRISIEDGRQSSSMTDVSYRGDIRERSQGDGYSIALDYEVKPSTTCLVLGIIAFFICQPACLIFLFPLMAKNEVERAANRALDDIEEALGR